MEDWIYLIVAFVVVDIFILIYVFAKGRKKGIPQHERDRLLQHWSKIRVDKDLKHAVLNADKLLDEILRIRGYQGPLGEKLKEAESLFANYDGIWKAHKLRNKIAHELDHRFSEKEARTAIVNFKRAFKDLGLFK